MVVGAEVVVAGAVLLVVVGAVVDTAAEVVVDGDAVVDVRSVLPGDTDVVVTAAAVDVVVVSSDSVDPHPAMRNTNAMRPTLSEAV